MGHAVENLDHAHLMLQNSLVSELVSTTSLCTTNENFRTLAKASCAARTDIATRIRAQAPKARAVQQGESLDLPRP